MEGAKMGPLGAVAGALVAAHGQGGSLQQRLQRLGTAARAERERVLEEVAALQIRPSSGSASLPLWQLAELSWAAYAEAEVDGFRRDLSGLRDPEEEVEAQMSIFLRRGGSGSADLAVMVIRGTADRHDTKRDWHSVVLGVYPGAFVLTAAEVVRMYQEQGCEVMVTGHSLGGYFAEVLSTTLGLPGCAFAAPGPGSHLGPLEVPGFLVVNHEADCIGNHNCDLHMQPPVYLLDDGVLLLPWTAHRMDRMLQSMKKRQDWTNLTARQLCAAEPEPSIPRGTPLGLFQVWVLLLCIVSGQAAVFAEDDECGQGSCAFSALQDRARREVKETRGAELHDPFPDAKELFEWQVFGHRWSRGRGRHSDVAGPREWIQDFRLAQGHLVTLGEGEKPLCVILEGTASKLEECDKDQGHWTFEKSYFRSYGWLKRGLENDSDRDARGDPLAKMRALWLWLKVAATCLWQIRRTELGSAGSEEVPVGSKTESEKVHLPIPGQVEEEPVVESMPSSSSRDGRDLVTMASKLQPGLVTAFLARSSTLARNSITDLPSESSGIWGLKHGLEKMVNSPVFELVFAVIIFMNTILMSVQVQYRGLNVGFTLQYPGEILVKIIALDLRFVYDPWNILDFLIVLAWFVDTISQGLLPLDPLLLRLLRLMKLFRMLRLGFDSLYVMITAIRGSVAALFWSTMLLVLVLTTVSLFLQTMLEYYITGSEEEFRRLEVYHYFGTFSRSMVSLCEMTLANWPTPSRVLTENVSEVWIFFVLSFQLLVGFSVMKVIMGVFLQNTFNVASNDDVIMMSQKERAVKVHTKKMEALFDAADENGNGRLDEEEFDSIIQDPACVAWLSAMGLEASLMSGKDLYKLLCAEGTSDLSAVELCNGVASLKGNATSLNMALLQKDQLKIKDGRTFGRLWTERLVAG
eukprot:g6204.t1